MIAGTGAGPDGYRFGRFELDARSGALRHEGVTVPLQEQPLRTLVLLLEKAGDVVSREELRSRVWKDDTFVDFEHGLNAIIKRLRDALGDDAERPTFIQTVPRRGYRFLVPAEAISLDGVGAGLVLPASTSSEPASAHTSRRMPMAVIAMVIVLAAAAAAVLRVADRRSRPVHTVRLAVLPFENLTGDQDQQFFADGLHEEMIVRLGRMHPGQLTVIARTSVMAYRETPKPIAAIARELGVEVVLEGSVRQAGERVRVTAQLIRAADQSQLWTETYDRTWNDVFAMQRDVGARVADSLAVELLPPSQAAASSLARVSPKAYEHYLRGRYFWNQRTRDPSAQLGRAIEQFQAAIAEQPDYALAYAGLADAYDSIFFANPAVGDTPYAKARDALDRALALDPNLASAYSTRGWMTLHFDRDLARAEQAFARALALDPGDSLTRFRRAHVFAIRGLVPQAEREVEAARMSDPLSASIADILGWFAYYRGDRAAAMQRMIEAAELDGSPIRMHVFRAYLHAGDGECTAALNELQPWAGDVENLRRGEAVFTRARCSPTPLDELYQSLLARRQTYSIAMFHFGRGDGDAFYEWLNRAIDERFPDVLYLGVDPAFSRERGSPKFQAVLRRIGL